MSLFRWFLRIRFAIWPLGFFCGCLVFVSSNVVQAKKKSYLSKKTEISAHTVVDTLAQLKVQQSVAFAGMNSLGSSFVELGCSSYPGFESKQLMTPLYAAIEKGLLCFLDNGLKTEAQKALLLLKDTNRPIQIRCDPKTPGYKLNQPSHVAIGSRDSKGSYIDVRGDEPGWAHRKEPRFWHEFVHLLGAPGDKMQYFHGAGKDYASLSEWCCFDNDKQACSLLSQELLEPADYMQKYAKLAVQRGEFRRLVVLHSWWNFMYFNRQKKLLLWDGLTYAMANILQTHSLVGDDEAVQKASWLIAMMGWVSCSAAQKTNEIPACKEFKKILNVGQAVAVNNSGMPYGETISYAIANGNTSTFEYFFQNIWTLEKRTTFCNTLTSLQKEQLDIFLKEMAPGIEHLFSKTRPDYVKAWNNFCQDN